MKVVLGLFLGLLTAIQVSAQSRTYVRNLDSNLYVVVNPYLTEGSDRIPLSPSDLSTPFDPLNIDQEKLNAAVFMAINEQRRRHRRQPLHYHSKLDILAFQYCSQLSRGKFNPTRSNSRRMEKYLYLASKKVGFGMGYTTVITNRVQLIRYNASKDYFYYRKDTETDLHLFYGHYSQVRDSAAVLEPIPYHTYESLAKAIVKQAFRGKNARKMSLHQYSYLACWIYPIERSIGGRSIPEAKMMIVLGGSRLQGLEE